MDEQNIQTQGTPQEDGSMFNEPEKVKKEHKHLKVLLGILATMIVLGGAGLGFLAWQNENLKKAASSNQDKRNSTNNPNSQGQTNPDSTNNPGGTTNPNESVSGTNPTDNTTTKKEISGWSTYNNPQDPKYSFQYPAGNIAPNNIHGSPTTQYNDFIILTYRTNEPDTLSTVDNHVLIGNNINAIGPFPYSDAYRRNFLTHVYYVKYEFVKNGYGYEIGVQTVGGAGWFHHV